MVYRDFQILDEYELAPQQIPGVLTARIVTSDFFDSLKNNQDILKVVFCKARSQG
jgi:hypothetical protein